MKPNPPPAFVFGFCQGCQRFDKRMAMVREHRYRCDECAVQEHASNKPCAVLEEDG